MSTWELCMFRAKQIGFPSNLSRSSVLEKESGRIFCTHTCVLFYDNPPLPFTMEGKALRAEPFFRNLEFCQLNDFTPVYGIKKLFL